ncbi:MAG: hypothetical protein AB7T49_11940 [Oligoflexales bacterium]
MNNDPNNTNVAFSQHTNGTQSNPFTGDLKGEFTSDFGTNTNAVSQIFKSSGLGEDRNKMIIIGVVVLAVLGGAFFYLTSSEDEEFSEFTEEGGATEEGVTGDEATTDATAEATKEGEEGAAPMEAATDTAMPATPAETAAPATSAASAPANSGGLSITSPQDGAQQTYDETQGAAVFQWDGPADRIIFARNSSMNPVNRVVNLGGGSSYSFNNPHPGTWYWKVENSSGSSEVRSFMVNPPVRRTFPVSQPTAGSSIAGNGGVVSWSPGEKVARYQVQLVTQGSSWASPQYRFSSSGNSVQLQGVAAGSYDMRVGAFSEVSGRWEWQVVSGVTVQ